MGDSKQLQTEGSDDLIEIGLDTLINNEIVKSIPILELALKAELDC